jgi:hypothetical protein
MAEDFEREEWRKFAKNGVEIYVARVAALELTPGIHDLAQLTPA